MRPRRHTGIGLINYTLRHRLGVRIKNSACKFKLHITYLQACGFIGDIDEARQRIESLFTEGMSWDNRKWNWHLDHIVPLGTSKDQKEFIERCHYSNIQPLWKLDNIKKGAKH